MIKKKDRKYDVTEDQFLVTYPNHRAINVIVLSTHMRILENHGLKVWENIEDLVQEAADIAKEKGWKTIFLGCDPLWSEYGAVLGYHPVHVRRSWSVDTPSVHIADVLDVPAQKPTTRSPFLGSDFSEFLDEDFDLIEIDKQIL